MLIDIRNESLYESQYAEEMFTDLGVSFFVTELIAGVAYLIDARELLRNANPNWHCEINALALEAPEKIIQWGSVFTSMAPEGFVTRYHPTNGLKIKNRIEWLYKLYADTFRTISAQIFNCPSIHLGNDLAHSLNINLTKSGGYELHVDRNSPTWLTFVNSLEASEGGETVIWPKNTKSQASSIDKAQLPLISIRPQMGFALLFDGHHPHEVTPYTPNNIDRVRITVPGDYYSTELYEEVDENFNKMIGVSGI
jgi:hypothetical protein